MKLITFFFFLITGHLFGQVNVIDVDLVLNKKTYLSYEHVQSKVIISNRGAEDLVLTSENGSWLEFSITCNGKAVTPVKQWKFQKCVIPAGGQAARNITLTTMFPLVKPGNYIVKAQVNSPFENSRAAFTRAKFFDVFNGRKIYSKQHGVKSKPGKIIGYQVQTLATHEQTGLYLQIVSPKDGRILSTRALGSHTGITAPQMKVDGDGHFHILYSVTGKLSQYAKFDDVGKILDQKVMESPNGGKPTLVSNQQGLVGVRNATKFDAGAAIEASREIHNISERPAVMY